LTSKIAYIRAAEGDGALNSFVEVGPRVGEDHEERAHDEEREAQVPVVQGGREDEPDGREEEADDREPEGDARHNAGKAEAPIRVSDPHLITSGEPF
jgi:hypothetical protein